MELASSVQEQKKCSLEYGQPFHRQAMRQQMPRFRGHKGHRNDTETQGGQDVHTPADCTDSKASQTCLLRALWGNLLPVSFDILILIE